MALQNTGDNLLSRLIKFMQLINEAVRQLKRTQRLVRIDLYLAPTKGLLQLNWLPRFPSVVHRVRPISTECV